MVSHYNISGLVYTTQTMFMLQYPEFLCKAYLYQNKLWWRSWDHPVLFGAWLEKYHYAITSIRTGKEGISEKKKATTVVAQDIAYYFINSIGHLYFFSTKAVPGLQPGT